MPISATRRLMTGGWGNPKIDIKSPVLYAPLWRPDMIAKGGTIVNGTGICTGSPLYLAVGANTVTVTQAGTFVVTMPEGGTVASGTMTVTGSPVTITAGLPTTITTTGATGNITCTVSNIFRSKDKNNYALTNTGALWTSQGRAMDGDDYIDAGGNPVAGVTGLTVLAWVKPTDVSANITIAGDYSSITNVTFQFDVKDVAATGTWQAYGLLNGETAAATELNGTTTTLAYGAWYHVAMRWDTATKKLYVNGVQDYTGAYVDTQLEVTPTANINIGRLPVDSGYFNGTIGDVIIYNRALNVTEIMQHFQMTKWRYK